MAYNSKLRRFIRTTVKEILDEQYGNNTILSSVDDQNEEILVYTDKIKELFSFVGEGIYDISVVSNFSPQTKEYRNEVIITFIEESTANIYKRDWDRVEEILNNMVGKNGLDDFYIKASYNQLILIFNEKYQLGY